MRRKNKKIKIWCYLEINVYFCSMVKDKGEKYKHQIKIHPDDFEKEGELMDENGNIIHALDIWEYCRYFADNIQLRIDDMFDGIDLRSFSNKHGFLYYGDDSKKEQQKSFMDKLFAFTADGRICYFQHEMETCYKKRINAMALCTLCLFINDIIHQKLVVLLKPTMEEVTNAITNLKSVTFTNKDGSSVCSDNAQLIASIKKAIPRSEDNQLEAYKIVDRQEVFTKELMQIEFFYYMSQFFNQFFDIKRRGLLTNLESEIIGYFLKWFGLSPVEVSASRLRQLRMNFNKVEEYYIGELVTENRRIKVQWQFIKYSDWSKGKINPLKCNVSAFTDTSTVVFPPNIEGLELLKR